MTTEAVNADFAKFVVVHTAGVDWRPSPSPSVWRKRLDLTGPSELSRVTSVVRYDAGSVFPRHPHPNGEEILVLDGVFSDEHGDYPTGTYLLNPEGFGHAPFSENGCTLFVKLRQYPGVTRRRITIDTNRLDWRPGGTPGITRLTLYEKANYPETVRLVRFAPGATVPAHDHPGGEEMFVIEGDLEDENDVYLTGSWARFPLGSRHSVRSRAGCTLYLKSGHLTP